MPMSGNSRSTLRNYRFELPAKCRHLVPVPPCQVEGLATRETRLLETLMDTSFVYVRGPAR
jgi:hypothetical protein